MEYRDGAVVDKMVFAVQVNSVVTETSFAEVELHSDVEAHRVAVVSWCGALVLVKDGFEFCPGAASGGPVARLNQCL